MIPTTTRFGGDGIDGETLSDVMDGIAAAVQWWAMRSSIAREFAVIRGRNSRTIIFDRQCVAELTADDGCLRLCVSHQCWPIPVSSPAAIKPRIWVRRYDLGSVINTIQQGL